MRHRFIALPLAALAGLAFASVALAGGWAQVTVTDFPSDPPAGEETTIGLSVLQHGETPISWSNLTVIATDEVSGTVIRTEAEAMGPEGSYVATIVFPSSGEWILTFDAADLVMEGSSVINVAPAVGTAAVGVAAATSPAFEAMPLLLLLVAATVVLGIGALLLRNGRGSRTARVSART